MKFKNYLNERQDYKETIVEDFLYYVKKDCKPFLKDMSTIKTFLYSGRKSSNDWFKRKVRKDRKPKDISKPVHEYLDNLFNYYFGIKARSKSLFVTADSIEASEYGDPYIIFPIGKYKIIWSPEVRDLWSYLGDMGLNAINNIKDNEKAIEKLLKNTYQEGNLKSALWSGNEIMLICNEYYAIDEEFEMQLLKQLGWLF